MDETRTRGPRADEPHPELPESLAWLYEPPPDERSRRRRSYAPGPPPTDIDPGAPRDPEALPTLLPFSAPPEEPPPAAHRGPVRGLRRAFARFDESRTDTSFRRPDAEEHDAERRAGGTTDWTTPVARPFAPPAHHGDDAPASEPDAQHDDDRYRGAVRGSGAGPARAGRVPGRRVGDGRVRPRSVSARRHPGRVP